MGLRTCTVLISTSAGFGTSNHFTTNPRTNQMSSNTYNSRKRIRILRIPMLMPEKDLEVSHVIPRYTKFYKDREPTTAHKTDLGEPSIPFW